MNKTISHVITGIILSIFLSIFVFINNANSQTIEKLKTTKDSISGLTLYSTSKEPLSWREKTFLPYICSKDGKYWMRLRILHEQKIEKNQNPPMDIFKTKEYKFSFNNRDYFIVPPETPAQNTFLTGYITPAGKEKVTGFVTGHDLLVTGDIMPILEEISKLNSKDFTTFLVCEKNDYPATYQSSFIENTKKVYLAYMNYLNQEKTKPQDNKDETDLKTLQELVPGKFPQGTADFRNMRWGMGVESLMRSEKKQALNSYEGAPSDWPFEDNSWNVIKYEDTIFGFPVLLTYHILENTVYSATYHITKPYADNEFTLCMNDFNLIKEALIKKYGPAKYIQQDWKDETHKTKPEEWGTAILKGYLSYSVTWNHKDTDINLTIKHPKKGPSAFEISILYKSNKMIPDVPIDPDKM